MLHLGQSILKSFLDLLHPPLCIHCEESLEVGFPTFCRDCLNLLSVIDPEERCRYCFSSELIGEKETSCYSCRENTKILDRMAAVFDYEGPAATLIKYLKYGGQPYLAQGCAGYLATQFLDLGWEIPDMIIPMPMAPLRRLERGYNQSKLLAEAFGKVINVPVHDIIKRRSGDYSQAGLNYQQRLELKKEGFSVKKTVNLYDKSILLIDDVMTTGSSLKRCAEALYEYCPSEIRALTICRAL